MSYFTHWRKSTFAQFSLHGPGMPQAPPPQQPPIGIGDGDEDRGAEAVNTENFCASFLPWQDGHSGSAEPITSFSNEALQSEQTYSNIGMCQPAVLIAKYTHYK